MNLQFKQQDVLNIISMCHKKYEKNLNNKKIIFISEEKNKNLFMLEVIFRSSNFLHLTGVAVIKRKTGEKANSYEVYSMLKDQRFNLKEYCIKRKDNTTDLKLQVLPQLMRIDKIANMIGEFSGSNIYLQTGKIAGNINACMGFIKDTKVNVYIPNTALREDIRKITDSRSKIIAILKKDIANKLYKNITYLKKNYEIEDMLKNKDINKVIDLENLYSSDKLIDKKIHNFYYSK